MWESLSNVWFMPFAIALAIWISWSDMARMKIPNKAVLALVGVYAVVGVLTLPFDEYLWRYVHLLVVLAIGFIVSAFGPIGAGDAKFAAAMAPFFALQDVVLALYLFCGMLLLTFALHRIARRIGPIRRLAPAWESWERKDFPMGIALSATLVTYLVLVASAPGA